MRPPPLWGRLPPTTPLSYHEAYALVRKPPYLTRRILFLSNMLDKLTPPWGITKVPVSGAIVHQGNTLTNQEILKSLKTAITAIRDLRQDLEAATLEDLERLGAPELATIYASLGKEAKALEAVVGKLPAPPADDGQAWTCSYKTANQMDFIGAETLWAATAEDAVLRYTATLNTPWRMIEVLVDNNTSRTLFKCERTWEIVSRVLQSESE